MHNFFSSKRERERDSIIYSLTQVVEGKETCLTFPDPRNLLGTDGALNPYDYKGFATASDEYQLQGFERESRVSSHRTLWMWRLIITLRGGREMMRQLINAIHFISSAVVADSLWSMSPR